MGLEGVLADQRQRVGGDALWLAARGFVMRRTVPGTPDRTPSVARLGPENSVDAAIYARRYLVESCGVPVMLIDEWFLPDLRDAVLRRG